jgi:hypothetical protein
MLQFAETFTLDAACRTCGITVPTAVVTAQAAHNQSAELDAWFCFCVPLMELLRMPFDHAADAYTGGDETALPDVVYLAQVRDILTEVVDPPTLQPRTEGGREFERTCRVLDVGDVIGAEHLLPNVTFAGKTRHTPAWFAAARNLTGCRIRWMTPADQVAMDKRLPVVP